MAVAKKMSAAFALSTFTLIIVSGCGQHSSHEVATKTAPPSVRFDAAPQPARKGEALTEPDLSPVESELDYVSEDADACCKELPANIQPQRILTAGSLNDVRNDDDFKDYFVQVQRRGVGVLSGSLRSWGGRRIEIMVRNSEGKPVQDTIVRVFAKSEADQEIQLKYQPNVPTTASNELVATVRTGSDGRTHFLPGLDGRAYDDLWEVEILNPEGELLIKQEGLQKPTKGAWWDFAVGHQPSRLPQQLDLALVIDTTGSMGDELEYLKLEISNIAARVEQFFPGIDQRFALILYRDNGDSYVTRNFDFTNSLIEFQQKLNDQHAAGGGDHPEAMHAALEQADELSWRSRNTARVLFLVGDAPPHARHMERTIEAVRKLRDRDVVIFPVAGSGARDEAEFALRTTAYMTMGQYLFLTDHSGIGLPHSTPHASEYNVEWLSAVMLRMIASELSGRDVLPSEILATEETGSHLLAQTILRHPESYIHPAEFPRPDSLLKRAGWSEIRPLLALAFLLVLALAEKCFARRPMRQRSSCPDSASLD